MPVQISAFETTVLRQVPGQLKWEPIATNRNFCYEIRNLWDSEHYCTGTILVL
jgi:hypothetical protein